jgi:hypothetical protein
MAKSPLRRYDVFGIIVIFAIIIGIPILIASFLLWINIRLFFIGISFLAFSGIAIFIARKRVAELKRVHPELFKALEGEDSAGVTKCALCGAEPAFRFRCYYCKKYFCEDHILPRNHHCYVAPTASFRTVLFGGVVTIFVGIVMLIASFMIIHTHNIDFILVVSGWSAVFLGMMGLAVRTWEETRFRHAIGPNYPNIALKTSHVKNNKTANFPDYNVHLRDFPRWLLATFIVAFAVFFIDISGLLRFSSLLEISLYVFAIITVVYFRSYETKIRKRKRQARKLKC